MLLQSLLRSNSLVCIQAFALNTVLPVAFKVAPHEAQSQVPQVEN